MAGLWWDWRLSIGCFPSQILSKHPDVVLIQVDVIVQVLKCQSRVMGDVDLFSATHSEAITLFILWIRSQGTSVRGSNVEMVMLALGNSLCAV